jgi:hypothetical protein
VTPSPTIETKFKDGTAERLRNMSVKYDPIDHNPEEALGYDGSGALIAFAHGCPTILPAYYIEKVSGGRRFFLDVSRLGWLLFSPIVEMTTPSLSVLHSCERSGWRKACG